MNRFLAFCFSERRFVLTEMLFRCLGWSSQLKVNPTSIADIAPLILCAPSNQIVLPIHWSAECRAGKWQKQNEYKLIWASG